MSEQIGRKRTNNTKKITKKKKKTMIKSVKRE